MAKRGRMVFGPVLSRRLGFSLGVDLIPFKTCALDCIYCQLGQTTHRTIRRKRHAHPPEVLRQVKAALKKNSRVDWITFSGSGEPTLHSGIGKMIRAIKTMTDIPVAVITSGVLLHDASVREALGAADLVIPDLDAGSESVFRAINRPHPSLTLRTVASGIKNFVSRFPGRVWLEVVLVKGVNDTPAELAKISALAAKIRPDRVQLNTVVRPPLETWAQPLTPREMRRARSLMARALQGIPVDIIAHSTRAHLQSPSENCEEIILSWLRRRPATVRDLSSGTGVPVIDVARCIARLIGAGKVRETAFRGSTYYTAP